MLLHLTLLVLGLGLLLWSASLFVNGASAVAKRYGMSPLLIGMIIVGFGTSAPEMIVSASASFNGNAGIAMGNALGSNITNIALILGLTALLNPITVQSQILRKELPVLTGLTMVLGWQIFDGNFSRSESVLLLALFFAYIGWSFYQDKQAKQDTLAQDVAAELALSQTTPARAWLQTLGGLILLVVSSRLLVWATVQIAKSLGISDLVVGLTIVAVGTSLPELASSVIAARKGEHDLALGNIIGSNIFNGTAVAGVAGLIQPMQLDEGVFWRDYLSMLILTSALFLMCFSFVKSKPGRINRLEAIVLLSAFVGYTCWIFLTSV